MEHKQTRLDLYVDVFNEVRRRIGEEGAVAVLAEIGKDLRAKDIAAERSRRSVDDTRRREADNEPATPKQRAFMDDLGVSYSPDITKAEASRLLDELKR